MTKVKDVFKKYNTPPMRKLAIALLLLLAIGVITSELMFEVHELFAALYCLSVFPGMLIGYSICEMEWGWFIEEDEVDE